MMVPVKAPGTLLAAALAALALPGVATAAPTLNPLKPCYVAAARGQTELVAISGTGFTPGALVDVMLDHVVLGPGVRVYPDGTFLPGTVNAPFQERGQRRFTVTATEQGTGLTASASSRVTALDLRLRPASARPSSRVRFRGRGFTGDGPVYAHYVYGGKERKTVRLAAPDGPCGTFDVRRREIPVKRPRTGVWTLQADQQRDYSPSPPTARFQIEITVRRAARPAGDR